MTQPEAVAPDQWGELERALEAVAYQPGDHPVVPIKHDAFVKTVRKIVTSARQGRGGDEAKRSEPQNHPHPGRGEGEPVWAIGSWLSAALDDPKVCAEMKRDINEWFDAGGYRRAPTTYGKGEREAYRLLTRGDTIQRGDQILLDDCETWGELVGWEIGVSYTPDGFVPVRRILQALQPIGGRRG